MKHIGLCAVLAVCGCVSEGSQTGLVGPQSQRFEARGDGWKLIIDKGMLTLREQVGDGTFEYYDAAPTRQVVNSGVRYEGVLSRHYVVAGLAEEDIRSYSLTILEQHCTDPEGHTWATTVSFDFRSEYRPTGCGGPLPH
jgi:hypothetical protein